jgi:hypothetical protein
LRVDHWHSDKIYHHRTQREKPMRFSFHNHIPPAAIIVMSMTITVSSESKSNVSVTFFDDVLFNVAARRAAENSARVL